MEGNTLGGSEVSDQALGLMMGPGFSAGDEVEWKDEPEGGGPVTVTILQWEYHPAITTTTFGFDGRRPCPKMSCLVPKVVNLSQKSSQNGYYGTKP